MTWRPSSYSRWATASMPSAMSRRWKSGSQPAAIWASSQTVSARLRAGTGGADRHRRQPDRDAVSDRGEYRRRRVRDTEIADTATQAQSGPVVARDRREECRPVVGDHRAAVDVVGKACESDAHRLGIIRTVARL